MSGCPACRRALTDPAVGTYFLDCRGCEVRRVAMMPPAHRALAFDALPDEAREAFKAEARVEWRRIGQLRKEAA